MKLFKRLLFVSLLFTLILSQPVFAFHPAILPLKERAMVINNWLEIRLEKVLPEIMRREKFDMWIIICQEYNEDPVYFTLVPATSFTAWRTTLATLAEVKVDIKRGKVRMEQVVCAQDTGEVINPQGIKLQIEECVTMGLGYALTEDIHFKGGKIFDENFDTYQIPRFSWLPKIEPVIVNNPDLASQRCGEIYYARA